ncbi:MAG: tRNA epoxyqueuosine(34) reductase QueG [Duncaniella sp.]|nr:tRNA epoxyqueuosine(34) reductase QueG [Duncaniella sp.]
MTSEAIKARLRSEGVFKAGIAHVAPLPDGELALYEAWLSEGMNGGMGYMADHADIRRDPQLLLPGAVSIISCAFSYYYPLRWGTDALRWARYSLGRDYHEVVRERLGNVASWIAAETGAECRVCVDTAPLRERYWAVRSGLGFIGLNDQLIIPGAGSYFFLGEILTTLPLEADAPCTSTCGLCRACQRSCPGKALALAPPEFQQDATHPVPLLDARKCLSYLTIEHRGELPDGTVLGNRVYGCDVCQEVCPHNSNPPVTEISEFKPRAEILALTRADILSMEQADFSRIFTHSAIKRTKLAGLRRNAGCGEPQCDN